MALHELFSDFNTFISDHSDRPLGVAVSGGGDSVALLYVLSQWGRRRLEVFCVDHGLNPLSAVWTQSVADHARRCGAGFTALRWAGDKPTTGVSAKARQARHRLLAEAARAKGVSVLCLAHTVDDIAEAAGMRAEGSNVGAPQRWGPSPVWPEGRDIFLYRPFVDVRRETLRAFLRGQNISWIDDPANDNPASLRARIRQARGRSALTQGDAVAATSDLSLARNEMSALLHWPDDLPAWGMIAFKTDVFLSLSTDVALRLLATAVVCAGGGERLPRRAAVEAVHHGLVDGAVFTLGGARIGLRQGVIDIVRQASDIRRKGPGLMRFRPGEDTVWDGRFVFHVTEACDIDAADGYRAALSPEDRALLAGLPPAMRAGMPVMRGPGQTWRLPRKDEATCLVLTRFLAASGQFRLENDLVTRDGTGVATTV